VVLISQQVRMHRERTTLAGTPSLIAPEAIRLLGDFAVPGEGFAVFAAISSFATAQYYPNAYPPSPLVSSAVLCVLPQFPATRRVISQRTALGI